jgi:GNAT superfamily N-acetyltransferase
MNNEVTYFKRYRMELALRELPPIPALPPEYDWLPWRGRHSDAHAEVMFHSFRDEIDAAVFPSFTRLAGCRDLMWAICSRAVFVPEATWLAVGPDGPCGTVQGLRDRYYGAIQNLGVLGEHRGRGLGRILLLMALHGFRRAGLRQAYLEVTARNEGAVRLYRRLGFRSTRTIYKAVSMAPAAELVTI